MPDSRDTIVALATPPGRGGIAVIRISGPGVRAAARGLLGELPPPRYAALRQFRDAAGGALDTGLALYFPAPGSFTGEDVLELHGHGGRVVVDLLINRITSLGARLARPGEFSERAFLNGKLDLVQAEAIADLIDSSTEAAARSAMASLSGRFSDALHRLADALAALRAHIEAALDFPDEDTDPLADVGLDSRLQALSAELDQLFADAQQGRMLRDGAQVVLLGPPNAGKSSLLNALARSDRAIVSAMPGTTRDTIELSIQIDGLPVHLVDTAGLRDTHEAIEEEGVRRARAAVRGADVILLVLEAGHSVNPREYLQEVEGGTPAIIVWNKIDLSGRPPETDTRRDPVELSMSVKTGSGLAALRDQLKAVMGYSSAGEAPYIARRRHLDAAARARCYLDKALAAQDAGHSGELVAEDLRLAQQCLGEITGEVTPDDLLDRIFSEFCIGK